jgi:hypothetical protein
MEAQPAPTGPDVDRLIVPDDLLEKLHKARERFRLAKEDMERVMDDSEMSHDKRVEGRIEEMRSAEKEVEDVSAQVAEIMKRKA